MLIALVGLIGSGKDTVGRHLVEQHGFQDIAFAGALKDALCAIFGWDRDMIEGKTPQSRAWRDQVDQWWANKLGIPHFTPRWAMQNIGTGCLREHFHDKIWIHRVEREVEEFERRARAEQGSPWVLSSVTGQPVREPARANVVITDGRFPNELDMVRGRGGKVVCVRRGPMPDWFGVAVTANTEGEPNASAARIIMEASGIHISEWAWAGYTFDAVIDNDGSLDQLFERADAVIGRRGRS